MGTRADFYLERDDKRLMWIGSLYKDGHPVNIPIEILIQVNPVLFEELTVTYLELKDSAIRQNGDKWPWPWADSRMSDYSYIFMMNRVMAYSPDIKRLYDPIKILQGEDLNYAALPFDIKFPIMLKQSLDMTEELLDKYSLQPISEEILKQYGLQPSKTV